MVSQKVDFTHSVNIFGALKMFSDVSGLKLGLTPSNPDVSGHFLTLNISSTFLPKCSMSFAKHFLRVCQSLAWFYPGVLCIVKATSRFLRVVALSGSRRNASR
jgi:hypothetical protein